VAGYVVSHDVSEREFQLERGGQWDKGKSCETFNPLGPVLVTADEVADPQRLGMRLSVNGTLRQDGSTATMIFPVAHVIWYLSQFMVLRPGDLINTGTPAGVALGLPGTPYLREGDVVELEIDGLGSARQRMVQA
jgi:2-keto-4-pentenoate hydratase/2-oxohepta-3-ene-1,7-dioic acid hydratase in catechol pathway